MTRAKDEAIRPMLREMPKASQGVPGKAPDREGSPIRTRARRVSAKGARSLSSRIP